MYNIKFFVKKYSIFKEMSEIIFLNLSGFNQFFNLQKFNLHFNLRILQKISHSLYHTLEY